METLVVNSRKCYDSQYIEKNRKPEPACAGGTGEKAGGRMETKRFLLMLFGLTALFGVVLIVYNFASMPPYGAEAASAVPLYASGAEPSFSPSRSAQSGASSGAPASRASQAAPPSSSSSAAPPPSAASSQGTAPAQNASSKTAGVVNINTADLAQLETLPRIGEVKAEAILDYRKAHGRFTSADQLENVKGIGAATLAALRPYITLG